MGDEAGLEQSLAMILAENKEMEQEIMRLTNGGAAATKAAAETKMMPTAGIMVMKWDQTGKTEMAGVDKGQPFRNNRKHRTHSGGFYAS